MRHGMLLLVVVLLVIALGAGAHPGLAQTAPAGGAVSFGKNVRISGNDPNGQNQYETAIAVNHEVNNPLTAVLGNTQLLLLQADTLDEQTKKRLRDIEKSALRIKDITHRLLKNRPHKTTEYPGGLRMLDLSGQDEEDR